MSQSKATQSQSRERDMTHESPVILGKAHIFQAPSQTHDF